MTHHLRGTSVAFAEKVFMAEKKSTKATVGQANVNLLSGSFGRQLPYFDRPRIKTPLGRRPSRPTIVAILQWTRQLRQRLRSRRDATKIFRSGISRWCGPLNWQNLRMFAVAWSFVRGAMESGKTCNASSTP